MRPCRVELENYLANLSNNTAVIVDLYTILLEDRTTYLRYSGWTEEINMTADMFPTESLNNDGPTSFVLGPRFGRSRIMTKIGIEPQDFDLEVFAGEDDFVGTFTFAEAARIGIFDNAIVELDRLFAATATDVTNGNALGNLVWFYGMVGEVEVGRSKTTLRVKSLNNLLTVNQFPRRIYHGNCNHIFGAPMCGYDRELGKNALGVSTGAGATTVAAASGSNQVVINTGGAVASYYVEGSVIGLSGANTGAGRTINNRGDGTQVAVLRPFLKAISVGDTFKLLPGCDHTDTMCDDTFDNLARHGGFEKIPPPEAAA